MAIARPVTKTIISTTAWGVPITDAVNANTADIASRKIYGYATGNGGVAIPTNTTVYYALTPGVSSGVTVSSTGMTTPTAGRYMLSMSCVFSGATGGAYIGISYDINGTVYPGGVVGVTGYWVTCPMVAVITLPASALVKFQVGTDMANVKTDGRTYFLLQWIGV